MSEIVINIKKINNCNSVSPQPVPPAQQKKNKSVDHIKKAVLNNPKTSLLIGCAAVLSMSLCYVYGRSMLASVQSFFATNPPNIPPPPTFPKAPSCDLYDIEYDFGNCPIEEDYQNRESSVFRQYLAEKCLSYNTFGCQKVVEQHVQYLLNPNVGIENRLKPSASLGASAAGYLAEKCLTNDTNSACRLMITEAFNALINLGPLAQIYALRFIANPCLSHPNSGCKKIIDNLAKNGLPENVEPRHETFYKGPLSRHCDAFYNTTFKV